MSRRTSTLLPAHPPCPFPRTTLQLPFPLYTVGHFQFKFASAEEHGAFYRRGLSWLDQRPAFQHLINLPSPVDTHLSRVHARCEPSTPFYVVIRGARRFRNFPQLSGIISDRYTIQVGTLVVALNVSRVRVPLRSLGAFRKLPRIIRGSRSDQRSIRVGFVDPRDVIIVALTSARVHF